MEKRVLVVDDDPAVARVVQRALLQKECAVELAANGVEALEVLRQGFRGLVLMDVHMDTLDGWDTISIMVEESLIEGNLVVMLTGDLSPEPRMEGLKEYVLDYITKPFQPLALAELVESYFEDLHPGKPQS